jgi:hypothetical protein
MLSYEELVASLEDAWTAAGLHEHAVIESVQPATHERMYRAELFPDHEEPLTEQNLPPWLELTFTWTAAHQLRAEGRTVEHEPLDVQWTYMVLVKQELHEHTDRELVRKFQRALHTGLRRFFKDELDDTYSVGVEVRRIYQANQQQTGVAYVQLSSPSMTDLSEAWRLTDRRELRIMLVTELEVAREVIHALRESFAGNTGNTGSYRSVETA